MSHEPPRNPKDLQALLKFCLETTKSEDAPRQSNVQPMDEERKKWLQEALKAMTIDVAKELTECINVLSDEKILNDPKAGIDGIEYAFDYAEEWVGDIDMANNFQKLGGLVALSLCLKSCHDEVRSRGCGLMAELAQNNPYCQQWILSNGLFHQAMDLLSNDESLEVKTKALYGVSCMTRDNPEVQKEFITNEGLEILMKTLRLQHEKLVTKSSFLMSTLLVESSEFKSLCTRMGFVQLLVSLLMDQDHNPSHEFLAKSLYLLILDNPDAKNEMNSLENVNQLFESRLKDLKDKEEFLEESEHLQNILNINSSSGTNNCVDR